MKNKRALISGLLFCIIVGSKINLSSPTKYDGQYYPEAGRIQCSDKWICLHEVVHKVDSESKEKQISFSGEFTGTVSIYLDELRDKHEMSPFEEYIYTFPGVGADYTEDGWGGVQELYAEIFTLSERHDYGSMPKIFERFYDRELIYKLWNQYPNWYSKFGMRLN